MAGSFWVCWARERPPPRLGVDENAAARLLVDPVALLLGRAARAEATELQVAVNDTCAPGDRARRRKEACRGSGARPKLLDGGVLQRMRAGGRNCVLEASPANTMGSLGWNATSSGWSLTSKSSASLSSSIAEAMGRRRAAAGGQKPELRKVHQHG